MFTMLYCAQSGDSRDVKPSASAAKKMEPSTARNEKWTLTKDGLEAFLGYLDPDRNKAGEVYEEIRRSLITFFRCNGFWNAEDPVDETLDRVIRRLGEIEVRNLKPFIRGVARFVATEKHKERRGLSLEDISEPAQPPTMDREDERDTERRLRCLEDGIQRLNETDRDLVSRWFVYEKSQKIEKKRELAQERGVSLETLRVQAHRARKRLRELVEQCMNPQARIM
jgi:RNA polymerase sigma factor (sigma-70 family)